jgi:hypothetical protein
MARQPSPRPSRRGRPASGRDYKAEYARRTAKGEREGKTRQQARGKKAGEHIERRRREIERKQGTTYERRRTRELADRQFKKQDKAIGRPQADVRAFFDRILRNKGYDAIKSIKRRLAGLNADRAKRVRRNGKLVTVDFSSIDRAQNEMADLADEYGGGDDDDWGMFFYH